VGKFDDKVDEGYALAPEKSAEGGFDWGGSLPLVIQG
jgi:hypothetical protein